MKARLTGKQAEMPKRKKEDKEDLLEMLLDLGLIDENTEINTYPTSVRNVINHKDEEDEEDKLDDNISEEELEKLKEKFKPENLFKNI